MDNDPVLEKLMAEEKLIQGTTEDAIEVKVASDYEIGIRVHTEYPEDNGMMNTCWLTSDDARALAEHLLYLVSELERER